MNRNIISLQPVGFELLILLTLVWIAAIQTVAGQNTAFTYQGRLNAGGAPANGVYDFTFTLFNASSGGSAIAGPVTNSSVGVTDGLFTTTLDLGANFPGADRWLEIGVRSNGAGAFVTLSPRQQLTPTPYAITAGDTTSGNVARLNVPNTAVTATGHPGVTSGFITGATVDNPGSGYASAPSVTVNANGPGSGAVITATISGGSVTALNVINAGSGYTGNPTLLIGAPQPNNYQVFVTSNFFPNVNVFSSPNNVFMGDGSGLNGVWKPAGNGGTTPGTHFLGTTDNQPLELKVNNTRALRLEPTVNDVNHSNIVNVIGGSRANTVGAAVFGATISGGGAGNYLGVSVSNRVDADFGSVGGGRRNTIQAGAPASTIGGGNLNTIQPSASESTIGGGSDNTIQTNAFSSTIGGGDFNTIQAIAEFSTIGGGSDNRIQTSASQSTIGGGFNNTIQTGASGSTIGGGLGSTIQPNAGTSTIGGGQANRIQTNAPGSTIGGGFGNTIQTGALYSTIGGGSLNTISGPYGTVPGGDDNVAGRNSFAAGHHAKANHTGAFVWADSAPTDFASTADNQFLVRAGGGVGINTGTPLAGLHVNQEAIPPGGTLALEGATHSYMSFFPDGAAAGRKGYLGFASATTTGITLANEFLGGNIVLFPTASGRVGIGRDPAVNKLEVEGNASKTVAGSWLANSDARIKQEIRPISGALEQLHRVRLVSFRYTDDYRQAHPAVEDRRYLNVVAQEFRDVFPDHVKSSGEKLPDGSDILQVDTYPLTIYSAAAIQELNQKAEGQTKRLEQELKRRDAENAELRQTVNELKELMQTMNRKLNGGAK